MIHIIAGEESAKNLESAFELDENLRGDILVLKDQLGIGPIAIENEIDHDALRNEFWKSLSSHHIPQELEDHKLVLNFIEKALSEEEPICFWLSPCATDVCAYFWLVALFKNHPDLLHTINIIGLPFLNEKGQLFYPKSFAEVIPKEFTKTKRLLKKVTPAEFEVEGEEWMKLMGEATWVRTYEGGKKMSSRDVAYYDNLIKTSLGPDFQKGSKIVNEAMKKSTQLVSPLFIEWRLRELAKADQMTVNGDVEKPLKDFEVKKIGETMAVATEIVE
jgi:hypothetical protein